MDLSIASHAHLNLAAPDPAHLPPRGETRTVVVEGHPTRVLSAPVVIGGHTWAIEIGTRIDEFDEILDEFVISVALASPVVLLLASAAGYWMSRGALDPLNRITRTATSIGAQNLFRRLPLRGVDDELDRLSATLNGMFARLDDAFQRVSRFTADASHELRTPVAIIRTAAEVCRRRPRTEAEYVETLDRILAETERTSCLIDDLLFLARADADAARVTMEALDLVELVGDTCEEARVLAEAADVRLTSTLPVACSMMGDPQGLRRLFLVLIDNAIKYTSAGGTVNVTMGLDEGQVAVDVRDTGIGISAEDLPRIFERFYRVASDRSRASGGVGLGLSIAQWIAACHNGEIFVESRPGAGSVFRVVMPIASAVELDFTDSSE